MNTNIKDQSQSFFPVSDIGTLLTGVINAAIIIGALAALMFIILGGIQWITSGGDKNKTDEAQKKITNAVVGLIVTVAAYAIWLAIKSFLGLDSAIR